MEYRLLGRSGLRVSKIAIGTMNYGRSDPGKPLFSLGVAEARRNIDVCLDVGVNLIDTADGYAKGQSEEILGEALEGKRNDVLIASKAWNPMGDGPNDLGLSRHHLIAACEASLKRLRTDHIDIYLAHKWDGMTPVEEMMEAFDSLIRAGKVRYIGCSNFSGWHVMKALAAADRDGRQRFVCQQIHYTLQAREAEYELVPIALSEGLGILVWSPLAGGLLTGKFRRGELGPEGSRHFARKWANPPIHDEERLWRIVDALVEIAGERGASAAQVAIAWTLTRPGVTSLVIGGRNDEQLRDTLAGADLVLTGDELDRLDAVSRMPLIYPYWHQQFMGKERFGPADLGLHASHMKKE